MSANDLLTAALAGERREFELPGFGRIAWYQDGPAGGGGRPLLLVHSINAAASAYEVKTIYEHFRAERPVYAIDLPGYGLSSRPDCTYTPALMCAALRGLLERIHAAHPGQVPDALALSLGCEFLARIAAEDPGALRTVALVSPTGFNRRTLRLGASGTSLARPGLFAVLNYRHTRRGLFGLLTRRPVIRYFLERTFGSRAIDEGMLDYDYRTTRVAGAEHAPLHFLSGYLFSADSGSLYLALVQPVWVVHGVRGDFTNYSGLPHVVARGNWTVEVMQTGALPHFEQRDEFIRRYVTWLNGPSVAARSPEERAA